MNSGPEQRRNHKRHFNSNSLRYILWPKYVWAFGHVHIATALCRLARALKWLPVRLCGDDGASKCPPDAPETPYNIDLTASHSDQGLESPPWKIYSGVIQIYVLPLFLTSVLFDSIVLHNLISAQRVKCVVRVENLLRMTGPYVQDNTTVASLQHYPYFQNSIPHRSKVRQVSGCIHVLIDSLKYSLLHNSSRCITG